MSSEQARHGSLAARCSSLVTKLRMPLRHQHRERVGNHRERDRQSSKQLAVSFDINIYWFFSRNAAASDLVGVFEQDPRNTTGETQNSAKNICQIQRAVSRAAQHQPHVVSGE